jgi:hypothetical protein
MLPLARELAADTYVLKLQRLQIKFLSSIANFPRCTLVLDFHTAFNFLYVYDYVIKLCRQQPEAAKKSQNEHFCSTG